MPLVENLWRGCQVVAMCIVCEFLDGHASWMVTIFSYDLLTGTIAGYVRSYETSAV